MERTKRKTKVKWRVEVEKSITIPRKIMDHVIK